MLYEALFVPKGGSPFNKSIIDQPDIIKYILNWDNKKDFGLIALIDNNNIGAVWGRLFSKENKGYGFINENIPELSIALKKKYRNKGIGRDLMNEFFEYAKIRNIEYLSLSVDKRSRAVNFYKKLGFKIVAEEGTAYTMKINI